MDDMECPLCGLLFPAEDYLIHLMRNHTMTFLILMNQYYNNLEYNDDYNTYDYYLELCEIMGNYEIGIDDLDKYMPKIECNDKCNDKCTICLESFEDNPRDFRKIITCSHTFCDSCCQQWFKKSKKCPLCMQEAQISSNAIESSESSSSFTSLVSSNPS